MVFPAVDEVQMAFAVDIPVSFRRGGHYPAAAHKAQPVGGKLGQAVTADAHHPEHRQRHRNHDAQNDAKVQGQRQIENRDCRTESQKRGLHRVAQTDLAAQNGAGIHKVLRNDGLIPRFFRGHRTFLLLL